MKARSVACCIAIFLFSLTRTYSQSTCPPNIDFESGNFDHWECFIGSVDTFAGKNRMNLNLSLPQSDRHQIISAASNPGKDQFGGFPKICPYGGNYSVKLGNENTGSQCEAISYTFTVPSTIDTFTFTYFYAVVLEDPQHDLPQQPRFFVTAYDVVTGATINCASYDYVSTAGLPGFLPSPLNSSVLYKNWTPTSLQFAGMGGHDVRLEFRTADCTLGGHFGYAYLDVASACSNILATAPYCIETNSLILDAPYGFQNYTWYNSTFTQIVGSGQSVTLSPPPVTTGMFYVDVEPYPGFGCRDTLQAYVHPYPVPDTPRADTMVKYCQFDVPDELEATATPGNTLLWYTTPTGGTSTFNAPMPATTVPGNTKYYVSQKALQGCEGFRRKINVNITPTPTASFGINNLRQCQINNNFIFTSTSTNLSSPVYTWQFGDGKTDTLTNKVTSYKYPSFGNYTVKFKATNIGLSECSREVSQQVVVVPKPTALFTYPDPICESQTMVTLTDNSTANVALTSVSKWWWNINGNISNTQTPAAFLAPPGGTLPVKLVVTTPEGCLSDTFSRILNIRFRPLPDFKYGDLMCNNEIIRFKDLSVMPAAAVGESVVRWNWSFDNITKSSLQNPSLNLNAGAHSVSLISENAYGCKSLPVVHTFDIYPKPTINMTASDSCLMVPIYYNAIDVSGTVANWTWKWNEVILKKETSSSIARTFFRKDKYVLTLIGYTDKGCKDTIIRPITIFDNESFAGPDSSAPYNEPIELNAHGEPGMQYAWSPLTGLNRGDVEKPVAVYDHDQVYQVYTVTDKGCKKQTQVLVKRYPGPSLFVPTAFTPNSDGKNDVFKVIPTGIKSFGYLVIYNRWGQLVFRTTDQNKGWDGTFNGLKVDAGTFVYIATAVDYKGRPMNQKGTFVLIR